MDDLFLNAAYALLLASTFTRSLNRLRLALIAASVCFVFFGLLINNWTMVGWNVLIGSLHGWRWYQFVSVRRSISLSDEATAVWRRLFPALDAYDFNALWAMGETLTLEANDHLTVAGEPNERVFLLLDGAVQVDRGGAPAIGMGQDSLVGEFSFANGEPAIATVSPSPVVRARVWNQSRLRALDEISPGAAKALNGFIAAQLVEKLNAK